MNPTLLTRPAWSVRAVPLVKSPRLIAMIAGIAGGLVTGCTDDASGDTDTDDGSSTSAVSATNAPTTLTGSTTAPTSTSTSGPTASTTTTDPTATSPSTTVDTGESSSSDGSSSSGGPGPGICIGVDQSGFAGIAHTMGGPLAGPCVTDPGPCGGDLVGTWSVEDNCRSDELQNIFGDGCPDAEQTVVANTIVGTRTFGDDGTYSFDSVQTLELEISFDARDCFAADCAVVGTAFDAEDGVTAVCNEDTPGVCTCLLEIDSGGMQTGTYTVLPSGEDVQFTVDGESTGPQPYCVANGRFDLWSPTFAVTPYELDCADAEECSDALGNASAFYVCDIERER